VNPAEGQQLKGGDEIGVFAEKDMGSMWCCVHGEEDVGEERDREPLAGRSRDMAI
jgi:hypothetical protein